jgi:hypothetical protein
MNHSVYRAVGVSIRFRPIGSTGPHSTGVNLLVHFSTLTRERVAIPLMDKLLEKAVRAIQFRLLTIQTEWRTSILPVAARKGVKR